MGGKPFGVAMLVCATLIWGAAFVAQSVGMRYMGPFTFNAVRFLIGAVAVFVFTLFVARVRRKNGFSGAWRPPDLHPGQLLRGGVACGVVLFIMIALQQAGICYTTVGKAGFITALYILFVPLLSLFLGRKVPAFIFLCAAIAMVGMYLLCIKEELAFGKGDILIFLSAVAAAGHILVIGHFSPRTDSLKLSSAQFFVCAALSATCAFLFEYVDFTAIIKGWVPILYTGLLSCGIAYTFQTMGQRIIEPVVASLVFSLEAVFAALFGWLLLGEQMSAKEISGALLIFAAIVMAQSPRLWVKFLRKQKKDAARL